MKLNRIVTVVLLTQLWSVFNAGAATTTVDCNNGESLRSAVLSATPGDQINVTGVCNESIIIDTDKLTIDGQGMTTIDAGGQTPTTEAIIVNGAEGVILSGLTVKQGGTGISIKGGSHVSLSDVDVNDSEEMGIHAESKSVVVMKNVTVTNAGSNGFDIVEASNIKINDSVKISQSGTFSLNLLGGSMLNADNANIELSNNLFGLHVAIGSVAFVNDSSIDSIDNVLIGVAVDDGSRLFLLNSQLTANGNGLDGIDCNISSSIDLDSVSSVSANNNGRNGISLEDTTFNAFSFFVQPGPRIEALGNTQNGVILTLGSKFDIGINSSLVVMDNGSNGMLIDDGSTAILTDTTITGHGSSGDGDTKKVGNIKITFGSRVSAAGSTNIDNIVCDKSALLRNGLKCDKKIDD